MNELMIEGSMTLSLPKDVSLDESYSDANPINNKWVIEIDGADYEEGTPEYWAAVRNKDHLLTSQGHTIDGYPVVEIRVDIQTGKDSYRTMKVEYDN